MLTPSSMPAAQAPAAIFQGDPILVQIGVCGTLQFSAKLESVSILAELHLSVQ